MDSNHINEDRNLAVGWEDLSKRIAKDPAASTWIKTALALALQRDPVDAANDAEVLRDLLSARAQAVLRSFPGEQAPGRGALGSRCGVIVAPWKCPSCGHMVIASSLLERGKMITAHFESGCQSPEVEA